MTEGRPALSDAIIEAAERGHRVPAVLLGSLMVTGIGQTLLYALLPLASRKFGLTSGQSSQVFALSALLWSLSSPFWGRIADRTAGVTILVIGMLGQALSNVAVGLTLLGALRGSVPHAAVYPALLLLRGINGILGSAVLPSAQGLALRQAPLKPRIAVVGAVATAWTVGTMTGPGFAAALAPLGLAAPLLVAAGLAAIASGVLALRTAGGSAAVVTSAGRRSALAMIRRRIWGFMIMQLAVGTAGAAVSQSTGFFVQDRLGLTAHGAATVTGIALSTLAGCNIAGQILAIRLRPAATALIAGGASAVAMASVAAVLAQTPAILVPALGVIGAGFGATTLGISTAASLMTRAGQQGAVAGTLASAGSLGAIISALAVMPFYDRFASVPFLTVAALAACVAVGSLFAPTPGRKAGGFAPSTPSGVPPPS
jgi:MFS family permease